MMELQICFFLCSILGINSLELVNLVLILILLLPICSAPAAPPPARSAS
jgi:hypothetical protein